MSSFSLALQTLFALLAFAGNSILCRLALQDHSIDANSFTIIRLLSGAIILALLLSWQKQGVFERPSLPRLKQAAYLFCYAAGFSYAYVLLGTAAGALILFVSVQVTILVIQYLKGKQSKPLELVGLALALMSFIAWMLPNSQRPSLTGLALMVIAGIAWGFYTLAGKSSQHPQKDTAQNFLFSLLFIPILFPLYVFEESIVLSHNGIYLAIASGALTSGLGYWVWYKVLPSFSALSAGVIQLSVPALAALGGIIWNNEPLTLVFMLASSGILLGIFLVLYSGQYTKKQKP